MKLLCVFLTDITIVFKFNIVKCAYLLNFQETYPSFHYTALLYLSDYGTDFTGGRFFFVSDGKNMTVEPRIGKYI